MLLLAICSLETDVSEDTSAGELLKGFHRCIQQEDVSSDLKQMNRYFSFHLPDLKNTQSSSLVPLTKTFQHHSSFLEKELLRACRELSALLLIGSCVFLPPTTSTHHTAPYLHCSSLSSLLEVSSSVL